MFFSASILAKCEVSGGPLIGCPTRGVSPGFRRERARDSLNEAAVRFVRALWTGPPAQESTGTSDRGSKEKVYFLR